MSNRSYFIESYEFKVPSLPVALYLVATPIGNLNDITIRALQTLAAVDYVACEDTRKTGFLLKAFAINNKLISYHEYSHDKIEDKLLDILQSGKSIALVSDAGTPLVSDPGFKLVQRALEYNIKVIPIPGASSVLSALIASGLPTDKFNFVGFLSSKKNMRLKQLEEMKNQTASIVGFESPHRLLESLQDMIDIFGGSKIISLARELTKKFEEIHTDTIENIYQLYNNRDKIRGEFVFVISSCSKQDLFTDVLEVDKLLLTLSNDMSLSKAAAQASVMTGQKKSELYKRLLDIKKDD
ncbi:16S rRNA (cytidine(1402)-2'-O)-methyltransferase [Bartonella sp. DGB1]|uniref:16S rRNA (cytidine(1402)-2'-O)-methyltransferase n=1 Tax=Bartonella sp. DGB1 TaxID=3239807 RepID=UPI0035234731